MTAPTAVLLLVGLAPAQPPATVPRTEVGRLAKLLDRLDPAGRKPFDPKDLAAIQKFLDANPRIKAEVERRRAEFNKLPPADQAKKLAELEAVRSSPQAQEALQKAVEQMGGAKVGPPPGPPPDRPARRPSRPEQPPPSDARDPRPEPPAPPTADPADAPPPVGPGANRPLPDAERPTPNPTATTPPRLPNGGQGFEKFLRMWEQNVGPLKDTPAVQQLARELFRAGPQPGGDGGPLAGLIDPKTADSLLKGLPEVGDRSGWSLPDFGGALDGLPGPSLPDAGSAPRLSAAGGAGLAGGLLLVAGLVVLAIWLVPKLTATTDGPTPVPGLGPWPLDPQAITTRADLVRAFEYLSVLLVGDPARAFSHEAAAAALREVVPAAAASAGPLADAYALARYTPADQPLTPEQIADARLHLCRLAGVPAA